MKILIRNGCASVIVMVFSLAVAQGASIPGLYNTGVDSNGAILADGATDPHYTISGGATFVTLQNGFPIESPFWMSDSLTSKWISPHANEDGLNGGASEPVGNYSYRISFDLTGFDSTTASITGNMAADDRIKDVLINGVSTGQSNLSPGSAAFTTFAISSGFVPGVNTIDFVVENDAASPADPSGLRVEISGTANSVALNQVYSGFNPLGGSTGNYRANGVSGNNVVGSYTDNNGVAHGFLYNSGIYTKLDPSGSTGTNAYAVSGNNVVGSYTDSNNVSHGFLYNAGAFTTIDPTGSTGTTVSSVSGNTVAGSYTDSNSVSHGFVYNAGTFVTIDAPGAADTYATGVSGNQVAGYFTDSNNVSRGFLSTITFGSPYSGGITTTFNAPGEFAYTSVSGISGNNVLGSYYIDGGYQAFLYNGSSYAKIEPPGNTYMFATGVDGNNVVGGYEGSDNVVHGFIYNASSYTTFDPPGSTGTYPQGVSGSNIVGYYYDSDGIQHGFLYDGNIFTTIDPTVPLEVTASGISGNNVVGQYEDSVDVFHGFFYNGSTSTILDPPGSTRTSPTAVSGNNVVGYYSDSSFTQHGFLYNGSAYNSLNVPGGTNSSATAVSGNNVVGVYYDSSGVKHGFLYNGSGYTRIDPTGSIGTSATGVSGNNVVGYYLDASYGEHGFLYNGSAYTPLNVPGSNYTVAYGVSGNNVVGQYEDGSNISHAFLYDGTRFITVDPPGSTYAQATGVSGNNVVGEYQDNTGTYHAFLYTNGTSTTLATPGTDNNTSVSVSGFNVVGSYTNSSNTSHAYLGTLRYPATVTLGNLSTTYDGTPKSATATTKPPGLNVTFAYNGLSTPPTNANSYTVVGTINDPVYGGSASTAFVINKAPATVTFPDADSNGNITVTFNDRPQSVSVTTVPSNLNVVVTYDHNDGNGPVSTPPTLANTNPPSYAVTATINDINYAGTANASLTIQNAKQSSSEAPAIPSPLVVGATYGADYEFPNMIYEDGNEYPVTYTVTQGANLLTKSEFDTNYLDGGYTEFTINSPGTIEIDVAVGGGPNFNMSDPVKNTGDTSYGVNVVFDSLSFTYDGITAHPATWTISPTLESSLESSLENDVSVTYTDSNGNVLPVNTYPINPDVYTLNATLTDPNNLYSGSGTGYMYITGPTSILTSPSSTGVVSGATVSFMATANGYPTPTVQWQVSTDQGMTYTPITNANSNTYSFVASVAQSGSLYRAVFTNVANGVTTMATSNPATLTVSKSPQTISAFASIPAKTFGVAPFTITPPTASSTLAVAVTVKSGPATISGNTVTITGAGTVVLAADQSGNANYSAAPEVTTSFVVSQATQTISAFATISPVNFGVAPFAITPPTASSTLPVVVTVKSGPATISGNTITITGVGTVTLAADQSGNVNYTAATEINTSFVVSKGTQTISAFATIPGKTFGVAPFTITPPTASSTLPVVVTVKSGPAIITGNTVTITGVGTVTLAADQSGNVNYSAATEINTSFVVSKGTQNISAFATISPVNFGVAPFVITPPTASSTLPVTVTVKSGPATLSGNMITITGAGTVVLAADQSGNVNYNPATEVTTSFAVNQAAQTISAFSAIAPVTFGVAPFTVTSPTASSNLPVTLAVKSGPATISGNTVTVTGAGTVTLAADQGGDTNFDYAPEVTTNFTVNKAAQTIIFSNPGARHYPSSPFTIGATASSGLTVTFSVSSGPATITSGILTLTGIGTVTIVASQAGNANFLTAQSVTQSFLVTEAGATQIYHNWESQYFDSTQMADPTISGLTATPENDGVPNLLKYLYNINPSVPMTASDRATLPAFGMTDTGDLTLTFGEYSMATGVNINVQTSTDLKTWTTLTQGQTLTPSTYTMQPTGNTDPNGDPYMQIEVQSTGSAKQFIRLNVTSP